jgi:ABC-type multidrug transport system ATPase subunit/pSer/pThr/pTyr-binding forkhead associated (FHA) protein
MDRSSLISEPEESPKTPQHRIDILSGLPEESFSFKDGTVIIGRAADADIQLRDPSVAPEHCRLTLRGKRGWVEDLGGGVLLNGAVFRSRAELASGDVIKLGLVQLRYRFGSGSLPAALPSGRLSGRSVMTVNGIGSDKIPLVSGTIVIGSDPECHVILNSPEITARHAVLQVNSRETIIMAGEGDGECRVNSLHFDEQEVGFGDQIQIGPFLFHHNGKELAMISIDMGAALTARDLTVIASGRKILDHVNFSVAQNQLVGIIGPIGAGKSTFLRALNGLRPADTGKVFLNGKDLYANFSLLGREFGWVPQEVIVHRELTVSQALTFAARLRLPAGTPRTEIERTVRRTVERLGIKHLQDSKISTLSGGETKTVSVAIELLSRPHVLILDEPTSGLDPAAEFRMMELLRQLADSGCTIVCSTHIMQNVYLFDKLAVLSESKLVFAGNPQEVREFFGGRDIAASFLKLREFPATQWRELYETRSLEQGSAVEDSRPFPADPPKVRRGFQIPLLLERQWAVLVSDWRNLLILIGQPLLIGLLLAWGVGGTADDSILKLFFAYIATLWFGCSNGAQAVVGELPIYLRERMVGLGRGSYLFSKCIFITLLTALQSTVIYGIARFFVEGIDGALLLQVGGLATMSLFASCLGLAISTISRSTMQAVLLVPLLIIPQIIFSGYTVPASSMKKDVSAVASVMPAFQLQRVMDTSVLWNRTIDSKLLEEHMPSFLNLNKQNHLKIGNQFNSGYSSGNAILIEILWAAAAYLFSLFVLSSKERGR